MYPKILLERDIQNGQKLVEALQRRLLIVAAFWLYFEEANEWRLVMISPLVGEKEAGLYTGSSIKRWRSLKFLFRFKASRF